MNYTSYVVQDQLLGVINLGTLIRFFAPIPNACLVRRPQIAFYYVHGMTEEYDGRRYDNASDEANNPSGNTAQNGTLRPMVFAITDTCHCVTNKADKSAELKEVHQRRAVPARLFCVWTVRSDKRGACERAPSACVKPHCQPPPAKSKRSFLVLVE